MYTILFVPGSKYTSTCRHAEIVIDFKEFSRDNAYHWAGLLFFIEKYVKHPEYYPQLFCMKEQPGNNTAIEKCYSTWNKPTAVYIV